MLRERRDDGPAPNGGAYSVTRWDDETGDADVVEYDAAGGVICRHEWRHHSGPSSEGDVVGEVVTFDAEGREMVRRPLKHASS